MITDDANTDTLLTRHENIVKAFSAFAHSLPVDHDLKGLMFLLADNLNASFITMKDYLQSDEDI
ncbi:hypothetical protein [Xenorhabdus szentirmaii]|uniref:Uncharacterized protein n=1 Tax=Xenorhabdus szentirmaii DSM 16338 TaxID=1427518 RepID=W1J5R4_9GAMM|nr:hypothetical protein [Xenorhabdus szentirmaii]PHM30405.1 hypothetical protein Xsze_04245 [Xenorhabdus szentirmaii DSM 16338]CDL85196.1 hypothetical protein XSR1_650012 [Xenorhabdus szentirmaii DSM 16338]